MCISQFGAFAFLPGGYRPPFDCGELDIARPFVSGESDSARLLVEWAASQKQREHVICTWRSNLLVHICAEFVL